MNKVLIRACNKYQLKQLDKAIEEMAELTKEICKYKNCELESPQEAFFKMNILCEVADVEIMLEQIKHLLNFNEEDIEDAKKFKIDRLEKRMNKEDLKFEKTMNDFFRGKQNETDIP